MPFGALNTKQSRGGIPLSSPPYPVGLDEFSDADVLIIRYYTTFDAVKDLVPNELELEDEPLITLCLYKYGFSPIGAYTEFVSLVDVKWQGEPYQWSIELILDNEGAIFAGRERWGIPKVFGKVHWDPSSTNPAPPGYVTGHVERPVGSKLVQMSFKPQKKLQAWGPTDLFKANSLHLRSIPAPNQNDPPALHEFLPSCFEMTHAEIWNGQGSVGLFNVSEFDPIHRLKVVRYESSLLLRHASAILHPGPL